jgi:hypothetical protein
LLDFLQPLHYITILSPNPSTLYQNTVAVGFITLSSYGVS